MSTQSVTIVRKEYTARGQLELVQDGSAQQPVHYRYLRDGKVDYQDHANGIRTVFGYDGRGLIGSVWHKNGNGETLSYRDYWRDDRDRITAWRKSLDASVNPMENGRGDRYGYDEAGQLTLASYQTSNPNGNAPDPERMDVFNYDALGNRMQNDHLASRGWMNFTRDGNGLNQYTGWWPYNFIKYDDDIGNGWGAPHGANGVLMQDGWITAGYNALNQPKMISSQVYNGTSNWMWFGFDPLGRCVKRWVSSSGDPNTTTATFLYYDGWNLLQEGAGGANAQRLYIHGARVDEVVKSFNFTTGQSAYHHYDARGHCTMLTDPNGNILEQYDYDAFGFPRFYDATGNSLTQHDTPSNTERGYSPYGNRFLFTGREWLTDLKLYDYRHRLYQPELGRFLQPDPMQFAAGDYNLYRYCNNDPINKSDPTGLTWRTNLTFLARWLLGVGSKQVEYKEDSVETREMADSPGAKTLRDRFEKSNGKDVASHAYGSGRAYKETVLNPKTADWSKTGAQVGGFAGATAKNNGDGTVTYQIKNTAGANSFFYHILPNSPFASGPMSNITQTFTWTERFASPPTSDFQCKDFY